MDETMKMKSATSSLVTPPIPPPDPKRKNTGSDQGGRKRVSQACDACRSKKLKCNGLKPKCSSCVAQRRDCIYGTLTKKRGLPEGYVRGLEKLLALLISKDGGGNLNSKFQQALVDEKTRVTLIKQWNGEVGDGETLAEVWRTSQLCKAFETLLPELDAPDVRGPDSKKPRLEPHAVGMENPRANSFKGSEPRAKSSDDRPVIPGSGKDDGKPPIGATQTRNSSTGLQNHSRLSAVEESAHVIPANLTVLPEINISHHGLFDIEKANLLDPPVFPGSVDGQHLDSMRSTLSVTGNLSGVMDEFALDLNFNTMMGTDDLFFEMSNLDYFSGSRDETYRNLGFLLPQDGPDPSRMTHQNYQGNYYRDEWSGS